MEQNEKAKGRKKWKEEKENIERRKKKIQKEEKEGYPSHFHFCFKILGSISSSSTTQNVVLSAQGKNERKSKWG